MPDESASFERFLAAARRGAPQAPQDASSADEASAPGLATRIAATWAVEKPEPWWLAPCERFAPWATVAVIAIVLGTAAYVRRGDDPSTRLAEALQGLVAGESGDDSL